MEGILADAKVCSFRHKSFEQQIVLITLHRGGIYRHVSAALSSTSISADGVIVYNNFRSASSIILSNETVNRLVKHNPLHNSLIYFNFLFGYFFEEEFLNGKISQ